MSFDKEFNIALLGNLKLKAKILSGLFTIIFIIQVVVISFFYATNEDFSKFFSIKLVSLGPFLILLAALSELYAIKYYNKLLLSGKHVSNSFAYLLTFIEISFPSLVMIFANLFLNQENGVTITYLLNSPPVFIYFIMILLSTLVLDFKLSLFAGIMAGIQFITLSFYYVLRQEHTIVDFPNYGVRGLLMMICGVIAGLVSKKIKDAVLSSLQSKDTLINKLDVLVKEKTAEIEEQNEEIMQQNKDITDSINYAKRIQTAILPKKNTITELFEEHFVLYKPKDIVSGDFYWASLKNGKKIIAAVDCTGHGVPGAFMSMVGSSLLNEIVNEKNITSASDILNALRERLIQTLQQTGAEGENKDGMDISLCVIENNTLEFSGANNPLYFIRNNELIEYKSDKQPIGIYHGEFKSFTSQKINLQKGDCFYIFTDGFADQFGGEKNKKFLYKKFQSKLLELQDKNMEQQKSALNEIFESWKGINEQVDDVLIIGIRA